MTAYRLVAGEWEIAESTFTDGAGSYTVEGLRTGTYRVRFRTFGDGYLQEYYQDKDTIETANDIAVVQGGTATANVTLDLGGQISGTVTGPSGAVTGATVTLYVPSRFSSSGWSWGDSATTTAGGALLVRSAWLLAPTGCAWTSATGLAPECWNDKPEVFAADTITAARNSTATAGFVLAAARKITGTVTSRAGGALTNPSVSVQRKLTGPEGAYWSVRHLR